MAKRKAAKAKKEVKKPAPKKLAFNDLVLVTLAPNGARNVVGRVTALAPSIACVNFALNENQKVIGRAEDWVHYSNVKSISLK